MTDEGPSSHDSDESRASQMERQENIHRWLESDISSRDVKWWYPAFHNVTAIVGAGVLGLPQAMAQLDWGPGVLIMVVSWVITLFTLWQMVEMHEMVPGRRFNRYHELGQYAFGEKLGLYIVVPQQVLVQVSVCIIYMLTGGKSLWRFHQLVCHNCAPIRQAFFIMIFGSVHFVLSQLPNLHSISGVSFAAAVMSVSYCTIAWATSVSAFGKFGKEDLEDDYRHDVFGFFSALGKVAFAYAGHNVVLEIQATMPSTPEKPSKRPVMKGVFLAYFIVAICYFPVALFGYRTFDKNIKDNILFSLKDPSWLIAVANMFVAIHMIGGYQVYAMPLFDMTETLLVRRFHFRYTKRRSVIVRSTIVCFTMIVAILLPYFGALLSIFGGFVYAPTSYFLPCIIWLILKQETKFNISWWANWICIVLGVLLMILAPIGGIFQIQHNIRNYKFWENSSSGN